MLSIRHISLIRGSNIIILPIGCVEIAPIGGAIHEVEVGQDGMKLGVCSKDFAGGFAGDFIEEVLQVKE